MGQLMESGKIITYILEANSKKKSEESDGSHTRSVEELIQGITALTINFKRFFFNLSHLIAYQLDKSKLSIY